MNKIVLEHYPLEKLPEDIQKAVGSAGSVTLTIETERPVPLDRDKLVAELRALKLGMLPDKGLSLEEATRQVRQVRDEWED
ncbi:hypothetical protein JP75_14815 [Devosia riboflavina]|uniref:Uncharacterized protein n=1 Tax=Devosia riboflavina TaxID=46914 RepID=A0A087M0Q1_9HYPH|nr:hypothetical protein [Devosia riboflavina]KFL30454.1 hypothetical protein JP75_14815 [Devosia riboflavina]